MVTINSAPSTTKFIRNTKFAKIIGCWWSTWHNEWHQQSGKAVDKSHSLIFNPDFPAPQRYSSWVMQDICTDCAELTQNMRSCLSSCKFLLWNCSMGLADSVLEMYTKRCPWNNKALQTLLDTLQARMARGKASTEEHSRARIFWRLCANLCISVCCSYEIHATGPRTPLPFLRKSESDIGALRRSPPNMPTSRTIQTKHHPHPLDLDKQPHQHQKTQPTDTSVPFNCFHAQFYRLSSTSEWRSTCNSWWLVRWHWAGSASWKSLLRACLRCAELSRQRSIISFISDPVHGEKHQLTGITSLQ
jgi:hypothetical protein